MIAAARAILAFTQGATWEGFQRDSQLQDAVQYRLVVLGEAARRVSGEFRLQHHAIAWAEIVGTRNILTHSYHRISVRQIWDIVELELPRLLVALTSILEGD